MEFCNALKTHLLLKKNIQVLYHYLSAKALSFYIGYIFLQSVIIGKTPLKIGSYRVTHFPCTQ